MQKGWNFIFAWKSLMNNFSCMLINFFVFSNNCFCKPHYSLRKPSNRNSRDSNQVQFINNRVEFPISISLECIWTCQFHNSNINISWRAQYSWNLSLQNAFKYCWTCSLEFVIYEQEGSWEIHYFDINDFDWKIHHHHVS